MANNIGPHIIGPVGPHLDLLRRWQPTAMLILDPDREGAKAAREACPNTYIVGRIYVPDHEVEERIRRNPENAARWAHDLVRDHPARPYISAWQIANEVCQFWDGLPLLTRFERNRMILADAAGYKCALFGFSVGQPDLPVADRMALWRLTYPALEYAEANGHVVLVHQYGAPDLWGPAEKGGADWLIHRLEHQVLPRLPYRKLRFVVGEYGIDGGLLRDLGRSALNPDHGVGVDLVRADMATRGVSSWPGWKDYTTAEKYAADLINIGTYCAKWRDRIIGYCVFTLGHNPPWQNFDIAGEVAQRLAAWDWGQTNPQPPPPPPPTGGNVYEPEVYDKDGSRRDLAWLKRTFGAEYMRANDPGREVFRLAQIRVTEGPATVTVRAQANNIGLQSHGVALSWPDGPHYLPGADFKTIYKPRAAVQWTDGNGYTGYGLGSGAYIYDPAVGGPHAVWILHNLYASDVLDKVGMLAGTNHVGPLHLVFDRRQDIPANMTEQEKLDFIRNKAWNDLKIDYNPEAALAKYARANKLGAPVGQEQRFAGIAWQAFVGGIAWCYEGQWDKIKTLPW